MRKIKFRAWDSDNEEFLSAVPYIESLLDNPDEPVSHHDIDVEDSLYSYPEYPLGETFNGRIIYEQFTGLKDVKGQDIYEGDIITAMNDTKEKPMRYVGNVHWNHSYWAIGKYKLFMMKDDSLKVIGNIHENEELLKLCEI